jgi:hypothetical protein
LCSAGSSIFISELKITKIVSKDKIAMDLVLSSLSSLLLFTILEPSRPQNQNSFKEFQDYHMIRQNLWTENGSDEPRQLEG